MEITLSIKKEDVMREIAVTTAYTGGKMDNDENALQRIPTVDEDEGHLERFWDESRGDLCQELIGLVSYEGMVKDGIIGPVGPVTPSEPEVGSAGGGESALPPSVVSTQHYELRLDVSKSFDRALLPSMILSLRSFFVHNMVAKWYIYTNKEEAGGYADKAATLLDGLHRKAVYRKRPIRPAYDG